MVIHPVRDQSTDSCRNPALILTGVSLPGFRPADRSCAEVGQGVHCRGNTLPAASMIQMRAFPVRSSSGDSGSADGCCSIGLASREGISCRGGVNRGILSQRLPERSSAGASSPETVCSGIAGARFSPGDCGAAGWDSPSPPHGRKRRGAAGCEGGVSGDCVGCGTAASRAA